MARLLALDWDQHEARYVVANTRGAQLVLEAAASIALATSSDEGASRLQLGHALQAALGRHKVGRALTLLGVERSQIEVLSLTLPPSSDAELPELVRHQAMRESAAITDDSSLDFVPLSDDPQGPRRVAAVALSRQRREQLQAVCAEAGVTPHAIVLRPYAATALFLGSSPPNDQACLLINAFADEIDLSVVSGGKVAFWRTLRQANVSHDPVAAKKLIAELNRTLVVVQDQLGEQPIAAAYLYGALAEHPALVEQLRDDFSLPVTLVDPFAALAEPPGEMPENPGRFSSLLGMLSVEAQHKAQAIDFLHPRKRPAPPDRRRQAIVASAAATVVLLLGGYYAWSTFAEVNAENESLDAELDRLDEQFKRAGKQQKVIQAIHDWGEHDVNWLDELRDLSLRFPSGRDAVLLRMALSHGRGTGATIDMVGVVRDPAIVSRIENNLRDKYHQISSRHVQERVQEKSYSWHFESSLVVAERDKRDYVSHLASRPEPEPAETAPPAPQKLVPPRPADNKR
jgi:Tfp pilus assembly PilM family ATPase